MTRARSGHEAHPVHGSDRCGRDPVAARDRDRARGVSRRRRRGGAVKKPCLINGCGKPSVGRGWCRTHYGRWSRHGDPNRTVKQANGSWIKFLENSLSYVGDECLIFPFSKRATIQVDGISTPIGRWICKKVHGEPPTPEHQSAHSCGNGHMMCVTPSHLSWKTPAENQADRLVHGTSNRGSRHGLSKLTEVDVSRIVRLLEAGASQQSIADRNGISQTTVSQISRGERWGWFTGRTPR